MNDIYKSKPIDLPNCLRLAQKNESKDVYEDLIYDFFNTQNYSLEEVNHMFFLGDRALLGDIELNEDRLRNGNKITCEILNSKYPSSIFCNTCIFNKNIKTRNTVPDCIRESHIMNLCQQQKRILDAIDPDKLISSSKIEDNTVLTYKEFYNYLLDKKSIKDEELLKIIESMYQSNINAPLDIKELKTLTEYLKTESLPSLNDLIGKVVKEDEQSKQTTLDSFMQIKQTSNKIIVKSLDKEPTENLQNLEKTEKKQTIEILSSDDENVKLLFTYQRIALDIKDNKLLIYGNINTHFVIPVNDETLEIINKLLKSKRVLVIVKKLLIHNDFIRLGITSKKIVPMDIIYNSLGIKNKKIEFEKLLSLYEENENKIDKYLLSYIYLSTKTDEMIEIENVSSGFFKLKSIEKNKKRDYTFEINTDALIKNIFYKKVTFKDLYFMFSKYINAYNERKITYNIIEISDKFIISCSRKKKKCIKELLIYSFRDAIHELSAADTSVTKFLEY